LTHKRKTETLKKRPGNVPRGFRNVRKTMRKVLAMYEPATDMPDFFNEIWVPMECCTDPVPVD